MNRNSRPDASQDIIAILKTSIRLLSIGMAVLLLFYLTSGITAVAPNEAALILRFGKLTGRAHPPGLLLALPPPIDEVVKIPVKAVQEARLDLWASSGLDTGSLNPVTQPYTLTGDFNIIRASFVVRYQVSDPAAYLLRALNRDALRDAVLYQAACRVIASMRVEDALTVGKNQIGLAAMEIAQQKLDALGLGIRLLAFETRELTPPVSVSAAFQAVVSAKVQARTLVEEANSYAASLLPGAEAEANRTREEADAYARQIVAKAQGEAAAFDALLKEYAASPALVRARLLGETLSVAIPRAKLAAVTPGAPARLLLTPQPDRSLKKEKDNETAAQPGN